VTIITTVNAEIMVTKVYSY